MDSFMELLFGKSEESALVRAVVGAPRSPEPRRRYAEWLRAKGDPRAEWLDLLEALERPRSGDPADLARLRARLDELSETTPAMWRDLFVTVAPTFNCGQAPPRSLPLVRFSFACPRRWASLSATADPRVRHCDGCQQQVFLCDSRQEAENRAHLGQCIAIPSSLAEGIRQDVCSMVTGRPELPDMWGRRLFPGG